MQLSNNSKILLSFFDKNNFINKNTTNTNNNSKKLLKPIFNQILKSYKYLLKNKQSNQLYKINIKQIHQPSNIIKPIHNDYNYIPSAIRENIKVSMKYEISFKMYLLNRNIVFYFITNDVTINDNIIDMYSKYVDLMIMWLYIIINLNFSVNCSKNLNIFLYFTDLKKSLPLNANNAINKLNVNTAFTTTCPTDAEIIIFRKEEWFKVFIHETFHNFALDFSNMNNTECESKMLDLFNITSDINLYEAYTECWAEIINSLFCSFIFYKNINKQNILNQNMVDKCINLSINFIELERTFSFFQMVKILKFMNIQYSDLYDKNNKPKYNEKTNVLSYYFIKTILLNNYNEFLNWCNVNNNLDSLFYFKKTINNQREFCKFIKTKYNTLQFIENINNATMVLNKNKNNYLLYNLRMSIVELI